MPENSELTPEIAHDIEWWQAHYMRGDFEQALRVAQINNLLVLKLATRARLAETEHGQDFLTDESCEND